MPLIIPPEDPAIDVERKEPNFEQYSRPDPEDDAIDVSDKPNVPAPEPRKPETGDIDPAESGFVTDSGIKGNKIHEPLVDID